MQKITCLSFSDLANYNLCRFYARRDRKKGDKPHKELFILCCRKSFSYCWLTIYRGAYRSYFKIKILQDLAELALPNRWMSHIYLHSEKLRGKVVLFPSVASQLKLGLLSFSLSVFHCFSEPLWVSQGISAALPAIRMSHYNLNKQRYSILLKTCHKETVALFRAVLQLSHSLYFWP